MQLPVHLFAVREPAPSFNSGPRTLASFKLVQYLTLLFVSYMSTKRVFEVYRWDA